MWDEKIECIESQGKFLKLQELFRSVNGDKTWYAIKKLDGFTRSGYVLEPEGMFTRCTEWDSKELQLAGIAKKVKRKNWHKNERVKMVYESEVCRE